MLRHTDLSAGEIAARFAMSKPSISKHLDILRQAGLVRSDKQGQYVIYSLNTSVVEDLAAILFGFVSKGERLKTDKEEAEDENENKTV